MSDDGFHEIQLNGKQLVFLFMAATVGAVVIFLCGVMVGRGVRGDTPSQVTEAAPPPAEAAAPASPPPVAAAPHTDSAAGPVPEPADDESVYKALTSAKPTDEKLKPAAKAVRPPPAPSPEPKAAAKAPAAPVAETATPPSAVTSGGFAVQVTALRDRSEAESIVKRLVGKGYQAYVLNPLPGKPPVYRVQVGRYQNRVDADRIASRLQKEEQFTPWVTH
jgi:DedD protein